METSEIITAVCGLGFLFILWTVRTKLPIAAASIWSHLFVGNGKKALFERSGMRQWVTRVAILVAFAWQNGDPIWMTLKASGVLLVSEFFTALGWSQSTSMKPPKDSPTPTS